MSDELFEKIRNGSEEEAREALDNLRKTSMQSAAVAIMMRNLSHGAGLHVAKVLRKEVV